MYMLHIGLSKTVNEVCWHDAEFVWQICTHMGTCFVHYMCYCTLHYAHCITVKLGVGYSVYSWVVAVVFTKIMETVVNDTVFVIIGRQW